MNAKISFAAATSVVLSLPAVAQDAGGTRVAFGVSQNLSYSNNLDFNAAEDAGVRSNTGLTFNYSTETKVERLEFSASSTAQFGSDDGAINGFTDPVFGFGYNRQSKNAGLTFQGSFRRAEVSSIVGTQELLDAGFITIDNGVQTDLGYSFGFDFGRTDPISGSITYSGNIRRFDDTSDPDLIDFDRNELSASLALRFDPRITGRVNASVSRLEEDGGLSRDSARLGIGADLAVTQSLSVSTSLTYSEVERTDGGITTMTDGVGFSVSATQDAKGGSYTASASSSVDENGRRGNIRLGRQLELRDGQLGFSLGASVGDDDEIDPVYSVSYAQELPRGASVSLEAGQSFETDSSGDAAINTSLSANYAMPVTPVSSFQASVNFRNTNGLGANTDDASRFDLDLSYRHELVQDWGLVGSYRRSFATEEGEADRTSDTVFLGLQKTFEWRP